MSGSAQQRYWIAFILCGAAAALPFLVTYRLPMTDLPQHAAQVTFWKYYEHPCYRFDLKYEFNWFTPYLLGYGVARAFAVFVPVNAAVKLTVYLAVAALPLALREVTKKTGADEWLSLLGFPLAFGFAFYWGFLNTMLAAPLGILFTLRAYEYALEPTLRRGAPILALGLALLAAHALIFVGCVAAASAPLLFLGPRRIFAAAIVYAIPLFLLAAWVWVVGGYESAYTPDTFWDVNLFRALRFFSYLLSGVTEPLAGGAALVLAASAAAIGLRPSRDPRRWVPAAVFALIFFFAPMVIFGTTFVYPRFALLLAAFVLFAFEPKAPFPKAGFARALLVAAILGWFGILANRFHAFGLESRNFERLIDRVPANRSVLFLAFDTSGDAVPGRAYLQHAAYYQVRKGGLISWSFANSFPVLLRYRPGVELRTSPRLHLDPRRFRWGTADSKYEYFISHAEADMGEVVFATTTEPVLLEAEIGGWWLYRRASVDVKSPTCEPLVPDGEEARRPVLEVPE